MTKSADNQAVHMHSLINFRWLQERTQTEHQIKKMVVHSAAVIKLSSSIKAEFIKRFILILSHAAKTEKNHLILSALLKDGVASLTSQVRKPSSPPYRRSVWGLRFASTCNTRSTQYKRKKS